MNKTTYARRKAQGRCAYCGGQPPQRGFVGCRACVTGNRQAAWARRDAQRPRGLRLPAPPPAPHGDGCYLAHCGMWHRVQGTPGRCGACGAVVLKEQA